MNRKRNLLWILLFLNVYNSLLAVDNLRLADARSAGLGGSEALTSPLFNPATVAFFDKKILQLNCFNRYSLKELTTASASFTLPAETVSASLQIASFGYDAYRESMFRLALGRKLNSRIAIGVSFQYAMLQSEIYDRQQPSQLATDIGLIYSPSERLTLGLLAMNCPSLSIGAENAGERYFGHTVIKGGAGWKINDRTRAMASLESERLRTVGANMGVEYEPFDSFFFRLGLKDLYNCPSFGLGYEFAQFVTDIAFVYHPVLGISSGCSLSCRF